MKAKTEAISGTKETTYRTRRLTIECPDGGNYVATITRQRIVSVNGVSLDNREEFSTIRRELSPDGSNATAEELSLISAIRNYCDDQGDLSKLEI